MAEKIVPDWQVFAQEILSESQLDLATQRQRMTERLIGFPPEKFSELHLEEWYRNYWKLVNLSPYINDSPQKIENVCAQISRLVAKENNPVKKQCFALALFLFGRIQEAQALMNQNLWSKNLREDFATFANFYNLVNGGPNLQTRAQIKRNVQITKFLTEKYNYLIKKYQPADLKNSPPVAQEDYQIYFCWFQGEKDLPPLVRCCYNSLKMNCGSYKICFIDEKNYSDYVKLPEHILRKFAEGKITRTHFSDILRINLLEQRGGLWMDSTILVTEPLEKHKNFWQMPYFTQKIYQEKDNNCPYAYNPSYGRWATFLQGAAVLHYPLLAFMKDFFNQYFLEFDEVIDYVLQDFMIDIAYDNIPIVHKDFDALPINNPDTNTLVRYLNAPYAKYPYDKILADTFLHKLNWRVQLDLNNPDTVFAEIQRRYNKN